MIIGILGISLISLPLVLGTTINSPKKQMVEGIAAEDVICNSGLTLMLKSSSEIAACVKPSTAMKLQDKGWGTILKESSMMNKQREQMIKEKETMAEEVIYNPIIIPNDFVSEINNKFFTLIPGTTFIYESQTEDGAERNEVNVTNNTKIVLGIQTVEVWDRVWLDDELIEETFDWYAQDNAGNVWYFGEDSKEYESGKIISTEGSWEAGIDGAKPGIIMQGEPNIGQPYRQEYYKGKAEDMAQIVAINEKVNIPFGTFDNCIKTKDWNTLVPGTVEFKYYCPQVGGVTLEVDQYGSNPVELIDMKKTNPDQLLTNGFGTLSGNVRIGPMCPVEPCTSKMDPYSSRQLILTNEKANVYLINLKKDGSFSDIIPKGTYSVTLSDCNFLGCQFAVPQEVTIISGKTTELELDIDTGIR